MKIGFVGLGKLGLPCALAIEDKGHEVCGYDVDVRVRSILKTKKLPYREVGAQELLNKSNIKFTSLKEVLSNSDIIFVAIQTPHSAEYEGITRLPTSRADFDYSFLVDGMKRISDEIHERKIVIIISTVLPGTIRRDVVPILSSQIELCYNPFFIAMGTTIPDFLNPEFVLLGVENKETKQTVKQFYTTIHNKPVCSMSIESAELTKVAYNAYITSKITIMNTLMEICHKIPGASIDDVSKTLKMATDRVVSPKYMQGGMGDGGGCHPRDNIALSWLAKDLNLSHDIYEDMMLAREHQTEWLAELVVKYKDVTKLPVVILGRAFKKGVNLIDGSPAILLENLLYEKKCYDVYSYDPHIDSYKEFHDPAIFFIGTNHDEFLDFKFPKGSVVLDPWRMIKEQDGVEIIGIGN